jgi:hypothetical protein
MNHPSEQELSAHLDHALPEIESMRIDAHAASCATCRETLARLAALDQSLRKHLTHDPGDAYFDQFAARVETRLRAARLTGVQAQEDDEELGLLRWLRTPSGLSWIGAAAAVVIGAGIALLTSREMQMQNLHRPEWTDRITTESRESDDKSAKADESSRSDAAQRAPAEAAPPATGNNERDQGALRQMNAKEEAAKTGSAYEVRRNAAGDEVPVNPPRGFAAPPAAPQVAGGASGAVYPVKARRAEPMGSGAPGEQSELNAPPASSAPIDAEKKMARASNQVGLADQLSSAKSTRHCGTIRDPRGGAIANAQVMVAETGTSVSSAVDGSFCIDVPPAGRTLVVMAVGYEPRRENIEPGVASSLALALHPVAVLDGGFAMQSAKSASGGAPSLAPSGADARALKQAPGIPGMISDSVSAMMATAMRVETDAARAHSATQYEAAAVQWEKVLRNVMGGPAENGIRFRVAQARHNAWLNDMTKERADAATQSILAYVARAPEGAERDLAQRWLERLNSTGAKAPSH